MNSLLAQLQPVLAQREQRAKALQLFFRDDDVDEDEPSLRRMLTLFLQHETPVNLGVIPGRLTAAATELLNSYARQTPGLFALNQHGWQHLDHERTGKKCEFGPSRSLEEQLADLAAGQARMNAAFGTGWFPAFIPPWNRCIAVTAEALDQLGFRVLSRDAGAQPFSAHRFCELPVTLDLYRWRGGAALRPVAELLDDLIRQITQTDRIGVMLHHKVMDEDAFTLLDALLRTFKQAPLVETHTFQSLLKQTET